MEPSVRWAALLVAILLGALQRFEASPTPQVIDVERLRPSWWKWANATYDPLRRQVLSKILERNAGVYVDKPAKQSKRLEKTVLVQVVESLPGRANSEKYKQQILNFFCYSLQHRLKSLLFLIAASPIEFEIERQMYASHNEFVTVVPYNHHMFWSLLATAKQNNVTLGPGRGDYNDSHPSFPHFGALPMLLPVLEVLELGYNAIYLDTDIAMIADPLPFIVRGTADIVLTPELKQCKPFPSLVYPPGMFVKMEPNTGVMLVISNNRTIPFVRRWLGRIVMDNAMNDQRTMHLYQGGQSVFLRDCDVQGPTSVVRDREGDAYEGGVRYCYLSEFLFATGLMEIFCMHGKRGANLYVFNLAMMRLALSAPLLMSSPLLDRQLSERSSSGLSFSLYDFLSLDLSYRSPHRHVHHPALFHANYCGNKRRCFEDRGLWLLRESEQGQHSCARLDVRNTHYAQMNWTDRIHYSRLELSRLLLLQLSYNLTAPSPADAKFGEPLLSIAQLLSFTTGEFIKQRMEGLTVRLPPYPNVFKVEDGELRPFQSMASLVKHGGSPEKVQVWSDEVFHILPFGLPLE